MTLRCDLLRLLAPTRHILLLALATGGLTACSINADTEEPALHSSDGGDLEQKTPAKVKSDAEPRDGEVLALFDDDALIERISAAPVQADAKKVKLQVHRVISSTGVLRLMKTLTRSLKTKVDVSKVTFGAWNKRPAEPSKKKVLVDFAPLTCDREDSLD